MDITLSFKVIVCFALYVLLLGSIALPGYAQRNGISGILAVSTVLLALYAEIISLLATPFILLLYGVGRLARSGYRPLQMLAWLGVVIGVLALSLHQVPGFDNPLVFRADAIGVSTLPYALYANFDKACAAVLIILVCRGRIRWPGINAFLKVDLPVMTAGIVIVLVVAVLLGVPVDYKLGAYTLAFAFFNLFITCVAEESFFRLVVHEGLLRCISFRCREYVVVIMSAGLFALAHFHTGEGAAQRMLLIFLSGLVYALVYQQSRSLLSAILVHFGLNIVHFVFFAYPAVFV